MPFVRSLASVMVGTGLLVGALSGSSQAQRRPDAQVCSLGSAAVGQPGTLICKDLQSGTTMQAIPLGPTVSAAGGIAASLASRDDRVLVTNQAEGAILFRVGHGFLVNPLALGTNGEGSLSGALGDRGAYVLTGTTLRFFPYGKTTAASARPLLVADGSAAAVTLTSRFAYVSEKSGSLEAFALADDGSLGPGTPVSGVSPGVIVGITGPRPLGGGARRAPGQQRQPGGDLGRQWRCPGPARPHQRGRRLLGRQRRRRGVRREPGQHDRLLRPRRGRGLSQLYQRGRQPARASPSSTSIWGKAWWYCRGPRRRAGPADLPSDGGRLPRADWRGPRGHAARRGRAAAARHLSLRERPRGRRRRASPASCRRQRRRGERNVPALARRPWRASHPWRKAAVSSHQGCWAVPSKACEVLYFSHSPADATGAVRASIAWISVPVSGLNR